MAALPQTTHLSKAALAYHLQEVKICDLRCVLLRPGQVHMLLPS